MKPAKASPKVNDAQLKKDGASQCCQEHGQIMRDIGHSTTAEEYGNQEHGIHYDAILYNNS